MFQIVYWKKQKKGEKNKMNYIKLDCPRCKSYHSLIFKDNNICKCPSCLKEFEMNDLIETQLINQNRKEFTKKQETKIIDIVMEIAHSDNGNPILCGIDEIVKFAKKVLKEV